MKKLITVIFCSSSLFAMGQAGKYNAAVNAAAVKVEQKVIAWRRDIHEHPELGNREQRTAGLVATHLKSLGIEVTPEWRKPV